MCSSDLCVAKFYKRKALVKKMNMSIGIENNKGNYHPCLRKFVKIEAHKNFLIHCNINGHWVKKCLKLHP